MLERVKDYWAKDLPVSKGQWNFDETRFQYFRDRIAAFEEFKSGRSDFWRENTASSWATQYDFDAIKKGWVKKEAIPTKGVARMQGFVFNTRRDKFKDPRVRHAFNLAFNFEDMNKTLLFGQYTRVGSYFDNSELKASGVPEGRELEILSEYKKAVAAGAVHHRVEEPGLCDAAGHAQVSRRGHQAAQRGRLADRSRAAPS